MTRIAVGQPLLTYDDKVANIAVLTQFVHAAAARHADVLVLPECPLVGWLSAATGQEAESIPGPYTNILSTLAATYGIAVVTGVEELGAEGLYNSAVLIDGSGTIVLHHRKLDELEIGREMYQRGDRLGVLRWGDTTVALDICADSWGDHVVATLALMGATIVFTPCAWAITPGEEQANTDWLTDRYLTLAERHGITFVAANSVGRVEHGPWQGRVLHGDSLIVGPAGVMAHGRRHQQDLLVVDLPDAAA